MPWQLTASTSGYSLTNILSGEALAFDASGRSLSDQDAYSNTNTLAYSGGVPITATNSGGRKLALGYQNGRLSEVQGNDWLTSGSNHWGQHVTYGYNGSGQCLEWRPTPVPAFKLARVR